MSLIDTAQIGNAGAGPNHVDSKDATSHATKITVCWDGDKVRGIRLDYKDGTFGQAGENGNTRYAISIFTFDEDETLVSMYLRDSGYGYGSLRQIGFTTSKNRTFAAGAGGFDHEASLAVEKTRLAGFYAYVNNDNFINAIRFRVIASAPTPPPVISFPSWETAAIGNPGAAKSQVTLQSDKAYARYFGVRWDGDKIRGIRLELTDGTSKQAGGYDDEKYALSSYTFLQDEKLQTVALCDSGYGYQSFRQVSFTTSRAGSNFSAGPQGVDSRIRPAAAGTRICGFHAWVNADNFINAFAFRLTDDVPFQVAFEKLTPAPFSYANGAIKLNGQNVVTIVDAGTDKHGITTKFTKAVKITNGAQVDYCFYSGAATLNVAVFRDGTFEAHFGLDGSGSAKGVIPGSVVSGYTNIVEALVNKYSPVMTLNVDEVYWPSTIDNFLTHMILEKVSNGNPKPFYTEKLDRNVLAQQSIALGENNNSEGACLRTGAELNEPSDTQDWFNSVKPPYNGVTSYAVVVNGGNGKLDIVYWWFFNYNQGKTVAGTSYGNHVSDWEHIKVSLDGVSFSTPGHERITQIVYDAHGDKTTVLPNAAEFFGSQVHLANGDHEAYPHEGVYDRPSGTHDYCKQNPEMFDQRAGTTEIYEWNVDSPNGGFKPVPQGASSAWKNPAWLGYRGRWGNWERGSVLGLVARLEKGPEGLWRGGEYAKP